MVLTYTQAEAKAKAKAESRKRPIRRVQAETEEQPVEKIKWKKERKRRRRRSHNPRITLKSVEREAAPIRLRSAARPVQKARKRSAELKELLEAAKKDWDTADYRGRREIQEVLKPKLPRGSIAETLRKQAGLAEACSSCDERVTKYRPLVRRRVLRRFSGPELRKRVEEALSERAETKKVQDQEKEEEEPADPGSEPDFDPPESPERKPDGGSGAAVAAAC